MKFIVHGTPQGKARARTFYNKNMGRMQSITPEKTKDYESLIRWSYKEAGGDYLGTEYVDINIIAIYGIPASWSKKKQKLAQDGYILPTTKPDVDNCAKVVLDALNGVAYADDKQVISLRVEKQYGDEPMLIISINTRRW